MANWVLSEPVSFDLRMPRDLFLGRLSGDPEQDSCHTQGIEIIDQHLYISCTLYNPRQKMRRSMAAESFLLRAPLADILATTQRPQIDWFVKRLTEPVPPREQARITDALINNIPAMLGTFMNWFLPLTDVEHVMGHPSGLIYDAERGGLWVANAVYSWDSYSRIYLLDPQTLEPVPAQKPITLPEHLGFMAFFKGPYLWSFNWGNDPVMILINMRTGEHQRRQRPVATTVAYQDCDRFDEHRILCAGGQTPEGSWYPHRNGVIHLLETSGKNLDDLSVQLKETLAWTPQLEEELSVQFGSRRFVSIETLGDIDINGKNLYGDYATPRPLTNAGMALSTDKQFIYFLPDDLPRAKLIRFKLSRPN